LVEPELIHVGLRSCFEIIITPADVKRGKPAPDMFLLAAERMGVAPEQCLVFEDGQAGLDAAKAAGMETVFVPSAP
ncbi:MAG: HAD family hydrolase, partial [Verrucomicrobiales bacterium]